tara:strand:- start:47 stop:1627 length:1581 start_codon:yes stop_codon:yes gene_type:complete
MVDEIKTENQNFSETLVSLAEILVEQNKSAKETQAKLDMVGDAIMQFVKVNKQNELEAREDELDERNKISEQLAKFEFKGLKQELRDGGVFQGFVGGLSFILGLVFGFFQTAIDSTLSSFPATRQLVRDFGTKINNFFIATSKMFTNFVGGALKTLFSPLTKVIDEIKVVSKEIFGKQGFGRVSKFFEGLRRFFGIFGTLGLAIGNILGKLFKPLTVVFAAITALRGFTDRLERNQAKFQLDTTALSVTIAETVAIFGREFAAMFVGGILDFLKFVLLLVPNIIAGVFGLEGELLKAINDFSFTEGIRDFLNFFSFDIGNAVDEGLDKTREVLRGDFNDEIKKFSSQGIIPAMLGFDIDAKRKELLNTFFNYVSNLIESAIDFFKDLGKRTLDKLVSFKDRAIERIKNIFDYLLKLPIAFFEGIKALSNVFGEGTPAERFNKAFNDTLVGRDITDTIGKAEISTERAEKIQEGSLGGAGGGTTNNIIDASDNSITDQSQNSGGFFSGVMDYIPFFANNEEAQSIAK